MKNVIVGSAIVGENLLKGSGGIVDKRISLIVGDWLVDLPKPQNHAKQSNDAQYPIDRRRVSLGNKQILESVGN